MGESAPRSWLLPAIVVGTWYAGVGILFAIPTRHVVAWRLGAWLLSAIAYALHVGFERWRLQSSPGRAAWHVACAVGLGAFGLAIGANLHSWSIVSTTQHRRLLHLALVIWPLITAIPALLVAFVASAVLVRAFGEATPG